MSLQLATLALLIRPLCDMKEASLNTLVGILFAIALLILIGAIANGSLELMVFAGFIVAMFLRGMR